MKEPARYQCQTIAEIGDRICNTDHVMFTVTAIRHHNNAALIYVDREDGSSNNIGPLLPDKFVFVDRKSKKIKWREFL
jgi:hypothetical protein